MQQGTKVKSGLWIDFVPLLGWVTFHVHDGMEDALRDYGDDIWGAIESCGRRYYLSDAAHLRVWGELP